MREHLNVIATISLTLASFTGFAGAWGIRARSRPPSAEDLSFDAAVALVRADAAAIRSEAALIFGRAN